MREAGKIIQVGSWYETTQAFSVDVDVTSACRFVQEIPLESQQLRLALA